MVADRWDTIDRYMILSSDTHAGAELREYKQYLEAALARGLRRLGGPRSPIRSSTYATPSGAAQLGQRRRLAASDAEGITGEVIFPNTLPPFFDILCHLSGVPWTTATSTSASGPGCRPTTAGSSTSATARRSAAGA